MATTPLPALPVPPSNAPWIAMAIGALIVGGLGIGWMVSGGSRAPVETTVAAPPSSAPPTSIAEARPPASTAPAPTEVRVHISVLPADATIPINDVEFPNPMDAPQPRQFTPV